MNTVLSSLADDADMNTVLSSLADDADMNTVLSSLADDADMNTVLSSLADDADMNTVLSSLADEDDMNTVLSSLADDDDMNTVLSSLADDDDMNTVLSSLADDDDMNTVLSSLADDDDMNTVLSSLADDDDMNTVLSSLADDDDMNTVLSSLADDDDMNTVLSSLADDDDMNTVLSSLADDDDMNTVLSSLADDADMNTVLSSLVDDDDMNTVLSSLADDDDMNTVLFSLADDDDIGYILEVELEYPKAFHASHNDYPLTPETLEISNDMLSPLQKAKFPNGPAQSKLTPNLRDKSRYEVHHRNLKFYTKLGMIVTGVHRVLQFKQLPWLKPYIDFNTNQRALATSNFVKQFFRSMNNAVYGKTQENLRKRINLELINNEKILKKRVANPRYKHDNIIFKELTVVQSRTTTLVLNRPIYIGRIRHLTRISLKTSVNKLNVCFTRTEYDFHYNHMKVKYHRANQLRLLFTDTDSLTYTIEDYTLYINIHY